MQIDLVDVTIHIDETLDRAQLDKIEDELRELDGIVCVSRPDNRPHLMIVEYNPARLDNQAILKQVTARGVHAELIGL